MRRALRIDAWKLPRLASTAGRQLRHLVAVHDEMRRAGRLAELAHTEIGRLRAEILERAATEAFWRARVVFGR